MPIIGLSLGGIIIMLFTLPKIIGLKFTIAMVMIIASGQKRCSKCDIFIEWEGAFCPCCKLLLRKTPRSKKYQEILTRIKRI